MSDTSWGRGDVSSPANRAFTIAPNDGADLARVTRGLYIGVAGNVRLVTSKGDDVIFTNMAAGVIHPIRVKKVFATSTTATGLIGVW